MSEVKVECRLPLDDVFLRRQCPHCHRQFKIEVTPEESKSLAEAGLSSYMVDTPEENPEEASDKEPELRFCPYCSQEAPSDSWWTDEQIAYFHVVARNVMNQILNEELIGPLTRMSRNSGFFQVRVTAREAQPEEPWISPEVDDMVVFDLPCCERREKIDETWKSDLTCFFCGFPHTLGS